jgi:hypothetical protein
MHIRGSSRKEIINLHKELIIFVLHEDKLFSWIEGKDTKLNLINNFNELITSTEF